MCLTLHEQSDQPEQAEMCSGTNLTKEKFAELQDMSKRAGKIVAEAVCHRSEAIRTLLASDGPLDSSKLPQGNSQGSSQVSLDEANHPSAQSSATRAGKKRARQDHPACGSVRNHLQEVLSILDRVLISHVAQIDAWAARLTQLKRPR